MDCSRNNAIDIAKGIAIICVVIAHAEMPGMLNRAMYLFHMPLFFITAGYFFSFEKNCSDPWKFITRRFQKLYIPFIKWSLFFLLIHNLLFEIGILNETYGNWAGGVTHPYSWHQIWQRFVSIIFSMGGYDEFLAGAYWFFRALLVASIAFLVCALLLRRSSRFEDKPNLIAMCIAVTAFIFALCKVYEGLKITTLVQGGYRDIMGTMFFALGFLFRQYESRISKSLWLALLGLGIVLAGAWLECSGMTLKPKVRDAFSLLITGCAGWIMTYNFSCWLATKNVRWWRWLSVCGELSLYILLWHVCAYKVVSALKIIAYDLPWGKIGCHMVIHDYPGDFFWVLYTIAGVGIPIAGVYAYRALKRSARPNSQPAEA